MNKEDIIRMALAAGVLAGYEGEPDNLIRFADLVAAAERAACIKACNTVDLKGADECIAAIQARGSV